MTVFTPGGRLSAAVQSLRRSLSEIKAGSWFTPASLATASMVSAALCLLSVIGLVILAFKVDAHADRPVADARAASDMRAWISPLSIELARAPLRSDGKPRLDITLNYVNVGREPARGVVVQMRSGTVPQDLSTATLDAVFAGDNTTCDSLISPEKGAIVFPTAQVARRFSQTDIMQNEEQINAMHGVLVVQACIKYQTAGTFHRTMLCEYVEPETDKPLAQRRMRFCADGNDAD